VSSGSRPCKIASTSGGLEAEADEAPDVASGDAITLCQFWSDRGASGGEFPQTMRDRYGLINAGYISICGAVRYSGRTSLFRHRAVDLGFRQIGELFEQGGGHLFALLFFPRLSVDLVDQPSGPSRPAGATALMKHVRLGRATLNSVRP
jgi:hypothetical protein